MKLMVAILLPLILLTVTQCSKAMEGKMFYQSLIWIEDLIDLIEI